MSSLEYEILKKKLAEIVCPENVVDSVEALNEFAKDHSFVKPVKPLCIVYPRTKEEVKEIIRIANEYKIPIVPVSSGSPHFRGDTVPREGGIIINLSKMKRILKIDTRNRAVRIEPGVTFGELVPELEKYGLKLNMPFLPRASKSVVTSYLEREPPMMPKYQFDYVDPMLTMEVVFGTGDEFRTGTASGPGSPEEINADMVNPFGPGDVKYFKLLSGSHGTFGIVTWAMVKVEVMPKLRKLYFIPFERSEDVVEPMNKLLRYGVMGSVADEILALNNFNLALILAEKWPEEFEALRKSLPPWVMIICIGGYRLAEERLKVQEKCLMEIAQEFALEPTQYLLGAYGKEKTVLDLLSKPWDKEPYWKLRYKGSCCEIFFLSPPSKASHLIRVFQETAVNHGYSMREIGGYLQPIVQGHAYHIEFDVPYDPSDSKEVEETQKFLVNASETLMKAGGFFSRVYGPWASMMYSNYSEGVDILRKLKNIFDPNRVLNPGALAIF
ncbi:MAG: FAD-binding oxidoreductase [Candidatus Bathyarchaeia archaeon]|nr:FAD-binding oxidoreductase [Candidatus Bathyarchaeota archaeon]